MTTTRARSGGTASAIVGRVLEQLPEAGPLHLCDRPLVVLHRPVPEVVVQRADGVLDEPPQRPAVLRDHCLESGACHLLRPGGAEVRRDNLLEVLVVEPALRPAVAELEAGIVVAGVVVVDQPDLLAVDDAESLVLTAPAVPGLALEHVEVVDEPRPFVELPDRLCRARREAVIPE